jgi:N-acetylglucosamine kinase-like BadF-type ATPase
MSILIADAGATNTSWASIKENDITTVTTSGINPSVKVDSEIESTVFDELLPQINKTGIGKVVFYGAGCKAWAQAERVRKILKEAIPKADIFVKTDVEGAGLSVFSLSNGIVVISGTGSSAAFMKGGSVADMMQSKAWPEGDLGSGAHIGALILNDYFAGDAPAAVRELIDANRRLSEDELFVQFQNPTRSKQIGAKATKDVAAMYEITGDGGDYFSRIVKTAVNQLLDELENHFQSALQNTPVKLVGTTAHHFESLFRECFSARDIDIEEIVKSPLPGLIAYHQESND